MQKALAILEFAMHMELEGRDFFLSASQKVTSPPARQMFAELAKMEEEHYQYIKKHYEMLKKNGHWFSPGEETVFSPSNMEYEVFYKRGEGNAPEPGLSISSHTSDLSALRMAIFIETDLHNFYKNALENTSDPAGKNVLKTLADWEMEHCRMIESQYEALNKEFWNDMGFAPF